VWEDAEKQGSAQAATVGKWSEKVRMMQLDALTE